MLVPKLCEKWLMIWSVSAEFLTELESQKASAECFLKMKLFWKKVFFKGTAQN